MSSYSMWCEKYQPKTLDDCVLEGFPKHVQLTLRKLVAAPRLPNLLLFGIAGTGKSTIARVLADDEKFSVDWRNGSLFTKDDVPMLARAAATNSVFCTPRVVFVDEADGLSTPAQYALRSVIEPHVDMSWVFTCNFRKKLIEPIASRFMQIECSLPPASERMSHISGIVKRCQKILDAEGVRGVPEEDIVRIATEKYPDIRQTITECQLQFSHLCETV
jgi:DNA polymerase III delta prime subunit